MKSWKAWVLILVIFLTGAAAGAFGMRAWMARQWPAMLRNNRSNMQERVMELLEREVGLSEDQKTVIRPTVARSVERMEAIHRSVRGEVDAILREMDDAVSAVLDPGQKERFAQFRKRMEDLRRHGPPPPPPGLGPPPGGPGMPPGPPPPGQ